MVEAGLDEDGEDPMGDEERDDQHVEGLKYQPDWQIATRFADGRMTFRAAVTAL
jgi:hypothetical protein